MIFADNSLSIGRTPLVRLNRIAKGAPVTMLAKIEGRNPAYSVKCRIGASMIWDAEQRGILKPGKELIEPTSGNTGHRAGVRRRGARLSHYADHAGDHVARAAKSSEGAGREADPDRRRRGHERVHQAREEIVASDPDRYVLLQQFKNPANPEIHFKTTGPEIWDDTEGAIDVLVAGVGTGGTITGVSRYIKKQMGRRSFRWAWSRQPAR